MTTQRIERRTPSGNAAPESPVAAPQGNGAVSPRRRRDKWRDPLRRRLLAVADIASVTLALVVVATTGSFGHHATLWTLLLLPWWLVLAKLHGLYDLDHRAFRHLTVDELPRLLSWAATGVAGLAAWLSLTPPAPHSEALIQFWLLLVVFAPTLRVGTRALWRRFTAPDQTIIVGSGPLARAAKRKLSLFHDMHVRVVGAIGEDELTVPKASDATATAWIEELIQAQAHGARVERVVVASDRLDESLLAALISFCRDQGMKLSVVPPTRGVFGTAVQLNHVADLPMIEYNTWDVSRSTMAIKRCIDVAIASVALVLLAPALVLIAVAVRLDSRGPALFRQRRAGREGHPFKMLKFRTMSADAEQRLADLIDLDELPAPVFKFKADPRVTRVGRHLRRWSLDELPQLINVLWGEMSLVGPRPEQIELVERYGPEARVKLALKPGITGPMQVFGRGELTFDERLAVERGYIENFSLRNDMHLLLLTLAAVLRGDGAY